MTREMRLKKNEIKAIVWGYLAWQCNTYWVLDELGYPTSNELYELLYLFKNECKGNVSTELVDTLTEMVIKFIDNQD